MIGLMDWFMEWVLLPFMVLLAVGLIVLVVFGVYVAATDNNPRILLKPDEWKCVKTESRTHLQPMIIGKVIVNQPITQTTCVEYARSK